jgi:hypothetical protein
MSDGHKRDPHRTVRVPDDEWEAAQAKGRREGRVQAALIDLAAAQTAVA